MRDAVARGIGEYLSEHSDCPPSHALKVFKKKNFNTVDFVTAVTA